MMNQDAFFWEDISGWSIGMKGFHISPLRREHNNKFRMSLLLSLLLASEALCLTALHGATVRELTTWKIPETNKYSPWPYFGNILRWNKHLEKLYLLYSDLICQLLHWTHCNIMWKFAKFPSGKGTELPGSKHDGEPTSAQHWVNVSCLPG